MLSDLAGAATAILLAAIGALHLAWARTPWPARTYGTLGDYVYGSVGRGGAGLRDAAMPGKGACVAVGIDLLAGAYCVLAELDATPEIGPHALYRFGIWALTTLLLARGVIGPLLSLRGTAAFRRWNLVAYSPLCLALGLGALAVAVAR